MTPRQTHKELFLKYTDTGVILRARRYAFWTLPMLMAELGKTDQNKAIARDFQEVGALLVNNLGAKLASLLFPGSTAFFKVSASERLKRASRSKGITAATLNAGLAELELMASQRLFINASYNQLVLAIKHLIVTGNVLIKRNSKRKLSTCYGLETFAIRRDGEGAMLDCVLRESVSFAGLSLEMQTVLRSKEPSRFNDMNSMSNNLELYTRIKRVKGPHGDFFEESQEVEGIAVGTPGRYPEHLCPWLAPTWNLLIGEHYGRGLVEDYAGGFAKISALSEAATLYGVSIMKFVNLVAPGMGSTVDELHAAEVGEYVTGQAGAVTTYEAGTGQKLAQVRAETEATFSNLARAFMYTGNTRNAERVTAFELSLQAQEANTVLGGNYSSLAESIQVPLAHVLMTEVRPQTLEGLLTGDIVLDVEAGITALGRASAVNNLIAAAREAATVVPALTQVDGRIDKNKLLDVFYAGRSVVTTDIFLTAEEQAKKQEATQQVQAGQQQIQGAQDMAAQADQIASLMGTQ